MKILVTGGAGFIGGNFVHYMVNKYPEDMIVNLDKLTYAGNLETCKPVEDKPNYKFIKGDIADREFIMDLFEKVSEDIKNAMKAKDKVALETLRNIKKFFIEAKTAPGANDTLTDADALKIMQKLVKQGKDSATIYVQQGRQDLADDELAQVAVIKKYLPKQMSAEELEAELKAIIAQVGAAGPKDMGKVMGVASKALAGKAKGRMISEVVKRLLN